MYVLDTSALIEAFHDSDQAEKISRIVKDEPLFTTSICIHEVLVGALTEKDRFVAEGIFSTMQILEHNALAARIGAKIEQELVKTGRRINDMDVLIAAICKANNGELITFDRDFARIRDFKARIL